MRSRCALSSSLALAALLLAVPVAAQDAPQPPGVPASAAADVTPSREGEAVPPGYRVTRGPQMGLVVAGALTLAVSYGIAAAVAVDADFARVDERWMAVPLAGPFIVVGSADHEWDVGGPLAVAGLFVNGVAQVAGATLLTVGLAAQRTYLVRDGGRVSVAPGSIAWRGAF